MAKKNYDQLAEEVIEYVGGKDNVTFFTHCITRLRFNVKDQSKVNEEELKKVQGVLGCQWISGQFQIIIGQQVDQVYDVICKKYDFEQVDKIEENLDEKKKKFSFVSVIETFSACLVPVIPVLMGCAFLNVILILLGNFNLITEESNTYFVLNFVGNSALYFLPVFVGAAAAKKFNCNIYMGMLMGAMLLNPDFIAKGSAGESMSVFGLPITYLTYGYGSTIFPAIMIVFVMSYVEKFWKKYSPAIIRSILVPLGTLLIMIPLALCVLGPLGQFIGTWIATFIMWIYNNVGFLAVAILACIQPILVMTGMHMSMVPARIQFVSSFGYDPLVKVASTIANYNQAAACFGVALRAKDKDIRSTALTTGVTALFGGATEPALFGITLRYRRPLYAVMIGSFIGGLIAGLFKTVATMASGVGLFALTSFISEDPNNIIFYCLALIIGMILTFVLTFIFGIDENK